MQTAPVETHELTKRYGTATALRDLDLRVDTGEVFGYLGPNGAGKTTTIRLLLGLVHPTKGSARVFGLDSCRDAVEAHRHVAYVPGEANLWPGLTGAETLHLLGRVHGAADTAYRDALIDRFDFDPSKKVRTYSKGNRQKLLLIAALMTRADLLILDEPTAGLDPIMERAFRECIVEARSLGQTTFLSSHILTEVEALCDRVGILRAGILVDVGTLESLRHLSSTVVAATFDGAVPDIVPLPGVSHVEVEGSILRCHVEGAVAPLLGWLASAGVRELRCQEPSLEELFLAHYGPQAAAQEATDVS